jgi:hypothetical protein
MKTFRLFFAVTLTALLCQSCVTVQSKRSVAKKKKIPAQTSESYALMEDWDKVDPEVLKRGNKARGLSEY